MRVPGGDFAESESIKRCWMTESPLVAPEGAILFIRDNCDNCKESI